MLLLLLLFCFRGFLFSGFSSHVMTHGAAADSTQDGVVMGNVASNGAYGGTLQTAFCMGH